MNSVTKTQFLPLLASTLVTGCVCVFGGVGGVGWCVRDGHRSAGSPWAYD